MPIKLQLNDQAPDFSLPDQNNTKHSLAQYRGQWILLYFYPKDDTPGCTKEACTIRDNYSAFKKNGVVVLGVSVDSVASHGKFVKKYDLPFTILADSEKQVATAYGVWGKKKFMGREYLGTNRTSFLINPQGKIAKIYPQVKPAEHAEEVLADVRELSNK